MYWFELPEMLRKFVLVAGLALVKPGTVTQLLIAILVSFGYVCLIFYHEPMKKPEANFSNRVANTQIFLSLLGAMAVLGARPKTGSLEQVLLDLILAGSNALVIVLGAVA